MKTHYIEDGKAICNTIGYIGQQSKTKTEWYAAVKKCKKCEN